MKNNLKFYGIITALILVTSFAVSAQPPQGRGYKGGHRHWMSDSCRVQLMADDLAKELSLSDKQKKEIEEIHYAHINEVKSLQNQYANDCVGARDARNQLRQKMDKDIKAVLDKDQQIKYDEFINERRGPHGRPNGPCK